MLGCVWELRWPVEPLSCSSAGVLLAIDVAFEVAELQVSRVSVGVDIYCVTSF